MAHDPISIITARRKNLESEVASIMLRLDAIKAEQAELAVAERVLSRLTGDARGSVSASGASAASSVIGTATGQSAKPEGIPTMPEMIVTVLQNEALAGSRHLEPKDILERIAERWWPTVASENVGPIAWRMWKQGKLEKVGASYGLPLSEVPAPPTLDDFDSGLDSPESSLPLELRLD